MKQVFPKILLAVFSLAMLGLSFSCSNEDPEYPVVITVKYLSDTTKVVPGAKITFSKNDINRMGYADSRGVYDTTFTLEMILDVRATIDTGAGPAHFYGESTVRLIADKTVHRSIFID